MKTPLSERGFLLPEIQCFLMSLLIRSISIHNMYLLDMKEQNVMPLPFL